MMMRRTLPSRTSSLIFDFRFFPATLISSMSGIAASLVPNVPCPYGPSRRSVSEDSTRRRRHVAWVVAVLALLVGRPLDAQRRDDPPPLSTARVAGQIGAGVLLTPVAFFGTAWLTDRLFEPDPQGDGVRRFQYAASYTTTWLAAAAGPALVGGDGRFPAALG